MKIPYTTNKIKNDFNLYFDELNHTIIENLKTHNSRENKHDFFKIVYPLFVLLESLKNSNYYIDPSKRILITEYFKKNEKEKLIELARKINVPDDETHDIKEGLKKEQFTPFFDEIYSDTLILSNNFYINNYRSCYISLRCILEDVYRHIYYKDHREEYWAIKTDYNEFSLDLGPKKFREYLTRTSFLSILNKFDKNFEKTNENSNKYTIFDWNKELYKKTSSYVHASDQEFMNRFRANSDIIYDRNEAEKIINLTKQVITLSLTFLLCSYKESFSRFNDYEKSLILTIFDKNVKYNFRKLFNI